MTPSVQAIEAPSVSDSSAGCDRLDIRDVADELEVHWDFILPSRPALRSAERSRCSRRRTNALVGGLSFKVLKPTTEGLGAAQFLAQREKLVRSGLELHDQSVDALVRIAAGTREYVGLIGV